MSRDSFPVRDFALNPEFSRGVSGIIHWLLLIVLIGIWVWRRVVVHGQRPEPKLGLESFKPAFKKIILALCLCLSGTNLLMGLLSYFYWYKNGWFDSKSLVLILFDFGGRALAWLGLFGCLKFQGVIKIQSLLKTWWGLSSLVTSYCLVVDVFDYRKLQTLPWPFLALDFVSSCVGLVLCYVGFAKRNELDDLEHREPLLNGNGSLSFNNGEDSTKTKPPFSTAGVFSLLSFSWVGPLIATGNEKIINLEDVPQLDSTDSVSGIFPYFKSRLDSRKGDEDVKITTYKLTKALVSSSKGELIFTGFLAFVYTCASYVGPYLIDNFVQYLNGTHNYKYEGYVLALTFFVAKIIECLCQRQWMFRLQRIGVRIRAELITLVYNKGLTLSCKSKQGQTSGEIINYMTVDAERIGTFSWYLHDPWLVVLQVGLALFLLYKNIGVAGMSAALAVTLVLMGLNLPLGKVLQNFQEKLMKSKDKRMKATSEILRNMRILKLQGWEMKFLSRIIELRQSETGWLKRYLYSSSLTSFLFYGAPTFISVAAFGTCMHWGIPLQTGKILAALATFRILQEPIYNLPDTISMIVQTKVSLDRLSGFLRLDDLPSDVVERLPKHVSDNAIEIIDGNFSWDVSSANPTLEDINIKVSHGMRVAVCGTVGSGKSSLLSCILGEIPKVSGTIKLSGTKVYVAQSPWIQSGKIQDNILFGKEMDKERYDMVLEVCSLKKDLEILSFGDQTVIGERGINLSGGQKQRIQIARALYQDADIYLFDDPFSAVDAHTGTHLFKVSMR